MEECKRGLRLMGNHFEITVVVADRAAAAPLIDLAVAEIRRIERLLTTYADDSQTNAVNRQAGIAPVVVDREVYDLVKRANHLSALTDGAFDLSYGSLDKRFWNFDVGMDRLPDPETMKQLVKRIDYRNIILNDNDNSIFLKKSGMRIGFGGIGKGYAAEQAKRMLLAAGVQSGIINASGDLCAWGHQADGKPWTIGIAHPDHRHQAFSGMHISGLAVATSGNYEKFVTINGKRYSHTIDPKTGFPVHGLKSVTVIAENAEFADALATPIMVMGKDAGLHLVNQLPLVAAIVIDDNNRLYTSKNITWS